MRLIDADKLRDEAEHCLETTEGFIALIDMQPTVDATIRKRPEKFIPCTCGCNRRKYNYVYNMSSREESVILECMKCGYSIQGKNEMDARRKWNEAMRYKVLEQFKTDFKPISGNIVDWEKFDNALDLLKRQSKS